MAVTTTVRQILDAAYAKSTKNTPGKIATESVELLQHVIRSLRGIYAFAARVNPVFFAESAVVTAAGGGWKRPETAEMIFRIEKADGSEVVLVPFDDRAAEIGMPAVYEFGQSFRPASADAINPQNGDLTFYYSKRPTSPATVAGVLDAMWTEQFNELLILDVALYLAIKDGRGEEVPGLTAQRDRWAQQFVAFLEHASTNERRRYGQVARFNTRSMVPLMSLLTNPPTVATG